jgi:hypothetical protein
MNSNESANASAAGCSAAEDKVRPRQENEASVDNGSAARVTRVAQVESIMGPHKH